MKFEYLYTLQPEKEIEIEDIGNVCLYGTDELSEYILIIKTDLGETQIIQYGPINIDVDLLPPFSSYSYARMQFSEARIMKTIDNFINGKNSLVNIEIISIEEAKQHIKNYVEYLL